MDLFKFFYADYVFYLQKTPLCVQAGTAILLIATAILMTQTAFWETFRCRYRWLPAWLGLICAALFAILPFHLSAYDFDDVYLVAKLHGGLQPEMFNDIPFFTYFDYFYRIYDIFSFESQRHQFTIFAVNGVFYWLYLLNALVFFKRSLGERSAGIVSGRASLLMLFILIADPGILITSTTSRYAIVGGALLLTAMNAIETVRRGPGLPGWKTAFLGIGCATGLVLQFYSFHQYSALWIPVLGHAFMTVRAKKKTGFTAWLFLLMLAASAGLFALSQRQRIADEIPSLTIMQWGIGIAITAMVIFIFRRPAVRAAKLFMGLIKTESITDTSVTTVYFTVTFGLFVLDYFGGKLWQYPLTLVYFADAANAARYTTLYYPFLVVLFGCFILKRYRDNPKVIHRLFIVFILLWEMPYVTGFYWSPLKYFGPLKTPWGSCYRCHLYQGNMLQIEELQKKIGAHMPDTFVYLPMNNLHRDFGDHFLVRALWPSASVASACSIKHNNNGSPAVDKNKISVIILSRKTYETVEELRALDSRLPPIPIIGSILPPEDLSWAVQIIDISRLDSKILEMWCRFEAMSKKR